MELSICISSVYFRVLGVGGRWPRGDVTLNLSFGKDASERPTRGAIEKSYGQFCLLACFVWAPSHLPTLSWIGYLSSTLRAFSHVSSSINDQTSWF